MRKVRIKRLPQAKAGGVSNGYSNTVPEQVGNFGGADIGNYKVPDISTRRTLQPVDRKDATLEAEKGEVAYGDINGDTFLETYVIGGQRHGNGGTPLNLPEGTFIFSDFRNMMIKDPKILEMFGKGGSKKGYTPAALAKQYDINKYRAILNDENSDKLDVATAELMIEEYQDKLGALALAQESLKNFEQGVPQVSMPYLEKRQISEEDINPQQHQMPNGTMMPGAQHQEEMSMSPMGQQQMARNGGSLNRFIPKYQKDGEVFPEKTDKEIEDERRYKYTKEYLDTRPELSDPKQWNKTQTDWWNKINELNGITNEKVVPIYDSIPFKGQELEDYEKDFQDRMNQRIQRARGINSKFLQNHINEIDECPCMKKVPTPLANGQTIMQDKCVPCEEMPMAQNGGSLNRMPNVELNRFIPRAQTGQTTTSLLPETMFSTNDLNDADDASYNQIGLDPNSEEFTNSPEYVQKGNKSFHYNPNADLNAFGSNQEAEDIYNRTLGDRVYDLFHQRKKPRVSKIFQTGGQLDQYQKKGEVTNKIYVEKDLPEGTVIKDFYSPFTKVGDYVRLADGTIKKVKSRGQGTKITRDTKTSKGTIDDYTATTEGRTNTDRANAIIAQGIADGTIKEYPLGSGNIRILGTFKPSFQDRIILSKTLNASGKKFGTDKYKVSKQSRTTDYSKVGKKSGSFVGGFTPDDYEKRFLLEVMTGQGASDEQAYTRIDEIYADPAKKAQARRMYLKTIGVLDSEGLQGGVELSDAELLNDDYYKNNYAEVTRGVEEFNKENYRTDNAGGDDAMSGFDHFDALGINPETVYEDEDPIIEEEIDDPDNPEFSQKPKKDAPWWLQDEINIAGNLMDRSRIKKYMPWAPGIDLEEMDPTFVDPTGAVNAQNAAGVAALQGINQFTGSPSASSARAMGIQGNMANQAAQTINQYDTQNVGIANNFEKQNVGIRNQERMLDANRSDKLYDENTIANQQYDNSMAVLRAQGRGLYTGAITNRWKTDALNQMYPDYAVDPSVGGQMYHDPNYRDAKPTKNDSFRDAQLYYRDLGYSPEEARKAAEAERRRSSKNGPNDDLGIVDQQYGRQALQEGGYVMGSNVFPFMFY